MRKLLFLFAFSITTIATQAQETMEKTMESRAREMFRVIGLDDSEAWKKFIRENYTKALIEKPMRAKRDTGGGGGASGASQPGTVDGKAQMYQMLHNDFGGGKITSLKVSGETVTMAIAASNIGGTFTLKFTKEKPWLIDSIGVEAGN